MFILEQCYVALILISLEAAAVMITSYKLNLLIANFFMILKPNWSSP